MSVKIANLILCKSPVPALVLRLLRLDQAIADQYPVHRRLPPAAPRHHARPLMRDLARTPSRMLVGQSTDEGFQLG